MPVFVWVLRHGERIDDAERKLFASPPNDARKTETAHQGPEGGIYSAAAAAGNEPKADVETSTSFRRRFPHSWEATAGALRPHDPPLTPLGVAQAREAGRAIFDVLRGSNAEPATVFFYTSPLSRCVRTSFEARGALERLLREEEKEELEVASIGRRRGLNVFDHGLRVENGLMEAAMPGWNNREWFRAHPGDPFMIDPPEALVAAVAVPVGHRDISSSVTQPPGRHVDMSYVSQISLKDLSYPEDHSQFENRCERAIRQILAEHEDAVESSSEAHHVVLCTHGWGVRAIVEKLTNGSDKLTGDVPYACLTKLDPDPAAPGGFARTEILCSSAHYDADTLHGEVYLAESPVNTASHSSIAVESAWTDRNLPLILADASCETVPFAHKGNNNPVARRAAILAALHESPEFPVVKLGLDAIAGSVHGFTVAKLLETGVVSASLVNFLRNAWNSFTKDVSRVDPDHVDPDTRGLVADCHAARDLHSTQVAAICSRLEIFKQVGLFAMDRFTPLLEHTWLLAFEAAAGAWHGATLLASAETREDSPVSCVYALNSSPGHHARFSQYGGYCFINNAAVAVRAFQRARREGSSEGTGAESVRVATLDLDYHHGDGTQQLFQNDESVLTVSLHMDPLLDYPHYSGFATDRARCNANFPLAAGVAEDQYLEQLRVALGVIARFDPSLLVVSLGLDTLAGDPEASEMGGMALEPRSFTAIGRELRKFLLHRCGGRVLVVQEGGYAESGIPESVRNILGAITTAEENEVQRLQDNR